MEISNFISKEEASVGNGMKAIILSDHFVINTERIKSEGGDGDG